MSQYYTRSLNSRDCETDAARADSESSWKHRHFWSSWSATIMVQADLNLLRCDQMRCDQRSHQRSHLNLAIKEYFLRSAMFRSRDDSWPECGTDLLPGTSESARSREPADTDATRRSWSREIWSLAPTVTTGTFRS